MNQNGRSLADDGAMMIKHQKSDLRADYMRRRRAMTEAERQSGSRLIARAGLDLLAGLAKSEEITGAGRQPIVTLYRSIRGEVSVSEWQQALIEQGWLTAYPITRSDPHSLTFHVADGSTRWKRGVYGIWEPVDAPEVSSPQIAVVILPGLAFTRGGVRLGYGGGYYDRFLGRTGHRAICIGVAYDAQMAPSLPAEATDIKMDYVITEREVYVCIPRS